MVLYISRKTGIIEVSDWCDLFDFLRIIQANDEKNRLNPEITLLLVISYMMQHFCRHRPKAFHYYFCYELNMTFLIKY